MEIPPIIANVTHTKIDPPTLLELAQSAQAIAGMSGGAATELWNAISEWACYHQKLSDIAYDAIDQPQYIEGNPPKE